MNRHAQGFMKENGYRQRKFAKPRDDDERAEGNQRGRKGSTKREGRWVRRRIETVSARP